jgi:hypothetical protein
LGSFVTLRFLIEGLKSTAILVLHPALRISSDEDPFGSSDGFDIAGGVFKDGMEDCAKEDSEAPALMMTL